MVLIANGAIINQLDPSRLIVPRAFLSTLFFIAEMLKKK